MGMVAPHLPHMPEAWASPIKLWGVLAIFRASQLRTHWHFAYGYDQLVQSDLATVTLDTVTSRF